VDGPQRQRLADQPIHGHGVQRQHRPGDLGERLTIGLGNVEDVRVLKSTGYKVLDDAAIAALRQWRFKPHIIYKSTIPIEFRAAKETSSSKK